MEARSRVTPWDVVFGGGAFDARLDELEAQAPARSATTPTELFMLPAAGELLRELLPESTADAHREVVAQISALMFHGFRFRLHGRRVVRVDEAAIRRLVDDRPHVGEWAFRAPGPAGYLQLPRNLFWARVAEDAPAEPADGFFWSAPEPEEGVRGARLDLLVCLGVRPDRPGLSLVEVGVESGGPLQHWADVQARHDGSDFANLLPGGELQNYYALATQAEVLKLASLCFWHLDTRGESAGGDG